MMSVCVVFDLDDTLYLERDYVKSGFQLLEEWTREKLGLEDFYIKAWNLFADGERGHTFDRVLRQAGISANKNVINAMVATYREHKPNITLPLDSAECLASLAGRVHIALVSDGPVPSQRNKINALGLGRFLEAVLLTSEFGNGFSKPHPRAFLEVQKAFPLVRRFVYVADNPSKDFLGPAKLGWATIRVRRKEGLYSLIDGDASVQPNFEVGDLSSLHEILLRDGETHGDGSY